MQTRTTIELRSRPGHFLQIETDKIVEVETVKSHGSEIKVIIRYVGDTKKVLSEPQSSEFVKQWQELKQMKP